MESIDGLPIGPTGSPIFEGHLVLYLLLQSFNSLLVNLPAVQSSTLAP